MPDRRIDPLSAKVIAALVAFLTAMAVATIAILPTLYACVIVGVMGASVAGFLLATSSLGRRVDERRGIDGQQ